jgi:hypothetical protein
MEEAHMIYISVLGVFLLGVGATLKYGYKVANGKIKDIGSFVSFLYLTLAYGMYMIPGAIDDFAPFVRVGIAALFLVKIITFIYDLWIDILNKRDAKKKLYSAGGNKCG